MAQDFSLTENRINVANRTVRNPNQDFPPFVAKTQYTDAQGQNHTVPLYTPYDATDKVQGVSWLTDNLSLVNDNPSASNGMTAMTPAGVRKNALCVTRSNGNIIIEGSKSTDISFSGKMTIGALVCDSIAGSITTNPKVKVTCVNSVDKSVISSGTTSDEKDSSGYFNIDLNVDKVPTNLLPDKIPTSALPDKIPASNISITGDMLPEIPESKLPMIPLAKLPASVMERVTLVNSYAEMLQLGIDKIQNGDAVKINASATTEVGYAGKIYVVVDETKLGSISAFTEFSAGTSASSNYAERAGYAGQAHQLDHDVIIPFTINGAEAGTFSTNFGEQFLEPFDLQVNTILKPDIEQVFEVSLS